MSFLTSLAIIFLSALLMGSMCKKVKLPSLLGILITGIIIGPMALNLIAPSILDISVDLRLFALIIILLRAGLSLDLSSLRKNGRSAVLMCFLPATFEIAGFMLFGTLILKMSLLDAAVLGSVMAAVSPAVVIPKMLKINEKGYGTDKGIPQIITAGASVDDVYVIALFYALITMTSGGGFSWSNLSSYMFPICGLTIYIMASMTPTFVLNRRIVNGKGNSRNFMTVFIAGLFGMIAAAPTYKTVTKWSDGSTTSDTDHGATWFSLILTFFVLVLVGFFIAVIGLINYIRNYLLYV